MTTEEKYLQAIDLALDKKGFDLVLLKLGELSTLTDYLLIISGRSDRQVSAIAEAIRLGLKKQEITPLAHEGIDEGRWALLDYGDFMIHVFQPEIRSFYDIEGLWSEARKIELANNGEA